MRLHGTTKYARPMRADYDKSHQNHCAECGCIIQNKSTHCMPCAQDVRRRHEANVALSKRQALRLCEMARERRDGR